MVIVTRIDRTGRFIAFEGGEGAGKSTQARLLAQALRDRGFEVEVTREPGGTDGAEAIRSLLLDPPGSEGWNSQAEALLFAAARADHVARLIRPALNAGKWVICDRFVDSSRAYQGRAGGLGDEAITALHAFGSGGLRPDVSLLITVDRERTARRLQERDGEDSDAIGGRSAGYHASVADGFLELAKQDPDGFALIDGNGSPQEVHHRVLEALANRLQGFAL
jgi:dTMP kinase